MVASCPGTRGCPCGGTGHLGGPGCLQALSLLPPHEQWCRNPPLTGASRCVSAAWPEGRQGPRSCPVALRCPGGAGGLAHGSRVLVRLLTGPLRCAGSPQRSEGRAAAVGTQGGVVASPCLSSLRTCHLVTPEHPTWRGGAPREGAATARAHGSSPNSPGPLPARRAHVTSRVQTLIHLLNEIHN